MKDGTQARLPAHRTPRPVGRTGHPPAHDRDWLRLAANNLLLHIHAPRVPERALRFTYTFGLGGLSILLLLILAATGILLTFTYTPSPDEAYLSIVALQTRVWYGQFIRNIHHWSGNLLIVVAFLHLLRVFFTGAFRPPRGFNWQLGLALMGLVAGANFTGYLLPWDQLSYWAVTVMMGIVSTIPLLGEPLSELLVGGSEVGQFTLRNFFTLHILLVPLGLFVIGSFHIWRIRKNKGTYPRNLDEIRRDTSSEPKRVKTVTTLPNLVAIELVFALVVIALLLGWSSLVDAPLLNAAHPGEPPNPAKAAWYLVGIQELLLHLHPLVGGVVIPGLLGVWLVMLPYTWANRDHDECGIWFRSRRGRRLALFSLVLSVLVTVGLVLLSESARLSALLPEWNPLLSEGALPLAALIIGVWSYGRLVRRWGASRSETQLALFVLFLGAFLSLTVIGNLFRGADWRLIVPWENAI